MWYPINPRRTKIKKTKRKIKASPRRRRRRREEKISRRVFSKNEKEKMFLFLGYGNCRRWEWRRDRCWCWIRGVELKEDPSVRVCPQKHHPLSHPMFMFIIPKIYKALSWWGSATWPWWPQPWTWWCRTTRSSRCRSYAVVRWQNKETKGRRENTEPRKTELKENHIVFYFFIYKKNLHIISLRHLFRCDTTRDMPLWSVNGNISR